MLDGLSANVPALHRHDHHCREQNADERFGSGEESCEGRRGKVVTVSERRHCHRGEVERLAEIADDASPSDSTNIMVDDLGGCRPSAWQVPRFLDSLAAGSKQSFVKN